MPLILLVHAKRLVLWGANHPMSRSFENSHFYSSYFSNLAFSQGFREHYQTASWKSRWTTCLSFKEREGASLEDFVRAR